MYVRLWKWWISVVCVFGRLNWHRLPYRGCFLFWVPYWKVDQANYKDAELLKYTNHTNLLSKTALWIRDRQKLKFLFSGAIFHIPLTKSATLNRILHCTLWQFSGALFYFRGLSFAFREPPCIFPLIRDMRWISRVHESNISDIIPAQKNIQTYTWKKNYQILFSIHLSSQCMTDPQKYCC